LCIFTVARPLKELEMEFDLLFLLLILAFYVLSQLGGKKRRQTQRPAPKSQPSRTRTSDSSTSAENEDPELEDALREIREALGWPSPAEPAKPAPRVEPADHAEAVEPPVDRRARIETTPAREAKPQPRRRSEAAPRKNLDPAAVSADPYARYTGVGGAAESAVGHRKSGIPELKTEHKKKGTHPILKQLQEREGARNAIVLAEILNEPAWRRQGVRRR